MNLLHSLIEGLTDTFFPPSCPLCRQASEKNSFCGNCASSFRKVSSPVCTVCGIPFITSAGEDHLCGDCIKDEPPFDNARSFFYYEDKVKAAIRYLKYSGKTFVAPCFRPLMTVDLVNGKNYDALLPVPLHLDRLRERGFNQSLLLANVIGSVSSLKVDPHMLIRTRPTLPQAGMKGKERIENVKGAFGIRKGIGLKGGSFLLIDDVYTTGATARECAKTLKKAGAGCVDVFTIARAVRS